MLNLNPIALKGIRLARLERRHGLAQRKLAYSLGVSADDDVVSLVSMK